ncbi:hypothetical protein WOLCODRAFT_104321 [Wolfiporia cocos MD-104 SS10]|uniref:Uncharacterized protein n=1 Tax=Wolfiporia cocos (strain MD-104) TaxID=742152 RepID=A0A2H3K600_WOLCO|nr:hypothetical protein WOLCODRAFT_104321 [Wolfiporia cocos MD-104 SS10]
MVATFHLPSPIESCSNILDSVMLYKPRTVGMLYPSHSTSPQSSSFKMGSVTVLPARILPEVHSADVSTSYTTASLATAAQVAIETTERDPEQRPVFLPGLAHSSPILYLPPILSTLPIGLIHNPPPTLPPSKDAVPLYTDSCLPTIDNASMALHRALYNFRPITPKYAAVPYPEAFNWNEFELPDSIEHEWYCVVFRSKRRDGSDSDPLYEADRQAHEEAVSNGGLILYWYGVPDPETRMNLATCIWHSRAHAVAATNNPRHARAMRLTAASYEHYELKRYLLCKVRGERGVTVKPYTDERAASQ